MSASEEPSAEHRLRYDEAIRAVEHQLASIDAAQTRAGLLLAVVAIGAAELGRRAVDRAGNPWPAVQVLAWVALAVCAAALVFVIWPRTFRASFVADQLPAKPAAQLVQDLTAGLVERYRDHGRTLGRVWLALRVAIVALVTNLAAWGSIVLWR